MKTFDYNVLFSRQKCTKNLVGMETLVAERCEH